MGLLDSMKQMFLGESNPDSGEGLDTAQSNFITAFGVLLYHVALSDDSFLDEEHSIILEVLQERGIESEDERERLFERIKMQHSNRVDLYEFTHEVKGTLSYEERYQVVHDLFRVAFSDNTLHNDEVEHIRKIAGLLYVPHDNFIHAKITARKSAKKNSSTD